jgi:lipopolysaccharide transport system permease protein
VSSDVVTVIEAQPQTLYARVRALWDYRGFYPLLLKEISLRKVRGTFLGWWWLVLRPLVPTAMAVIAFTFLAAIDTRSLPYAIFYLAGFLTWHIFHASVLFLPRTLMWVRGMIRKTYFPRLLVPLASVGPPLIELFVVFVLLVIAVAVYFWKDGLLYIRFHWGLLLILPCILLALAFGVAIGMVLSVMAIFFRDIIFSIGYFIQIGMFLTPVIYPISAVPEGARWIMYLGNPMASLVETSRWAVTGQGLLDPPWLFIAVIQIALVVVFCTIFFLRAEPYVADSI